MSERQPLLAQAAAEAARGAAARQGWQSSAYGIAGPSTTTGTSHGTAPSSPETRPNSMYSADWRRARHYSPHTPSHRRPSDDISSIVSYTPSRQAFRRAHVWIQFPFVFLLSVGLTAALCAWRRQVKWVELGIGAVAWLAGEALRKPIFQSFTFESLSRNGDVRRGSGLALPTALQAITDEFLRLGAVALVVKLLPETPVHIDRRRAPPSSTHEPLPPLDILFWSALYLALGYALTEIAMHCYDFYQRLELYDDVLHEEQDDDLDYDDDEFSLANANVNQADQNGKPLTVEGALENQEVPVLDIDAILREEQRADLEARMGAPMYDIPVGVVLIWRIDSLLLSLILTLLLSLPFRTTDPTLVALPLWPTFAVATALHVFVSLLWLVRVPRIGIPSVSYATLVILVVFLFAVLSLWGVLA